MVKMKDEKLKEYIGQMIKVGYLDWATPRDVKGVLMRVGGKYNFVMLPLGSEVKINKSCFVIEEIFNGETWEKVKDE